MRRWVAAAAVASLVTGTAACGGDGGESGSGTLTVFAAASLTSTFEVIAERFEETHAGVEVELNLAGSSDLSAQIQSGAPADVFASADEANMEKLEAEGLQGADPQVFATNTLTIATPPDDPAGVRSLEDLADEDLTVVVCAPEVPCGAAAQAVAEEAGITLRPDSEEQSVTDVLGKVASGEADAGLVYVTDVIAAGGDVRAVGLPESSGAVTTYPIAPVAGSPSADLAQEFIDLVLSDEGRRVLRDAGFGQP